MHILDKSDAPLQKVIFQSARNLLKIKSYQFHLFPYNNIEMAKNESDRIA